MRGSVQTVADFRGGVNLRDSVFDLQPNQARDARDVVSELRGSITTRNGCPSFCAAPGVMDTLWFEPDGVYGVTSDGSFYRLSPVQTLLKAGLTNSVWMLATAPPANTGQLYAVNGVDTPQVYDGVTMVDWVAATGAVPNGTLIVYHNSQMFISGVAAHRSRLYASNLTDPFDWDPAVPGTSAYELDLNQSEHDLITGLGVLGEYLLVFKRTSIYVVTDPVTGANRRMAARVGTTSPRTIVETPHGVIFLGSDANVWAMDGNSATSFSDPVAPLLAQVDTELAIVSGSAAYVDQHYYLTVPLLTGERVTLDYDFRMKSWWLHSFAPLCWAAYPDTTLAQEGITGTRRLLYGQAPDGGNICEGFSDEGNAEDNGVPFTAYWKGPHQAFGSVATRKRVRQIRIDGRGEDVQFSLSKDYASTATVIKTADLSTSSTVGRVQLVTPGVARAWSLEIQGPSFFEIDAQSWAFTARAD